MILQSTSLLLPVDSGFGEGASLELTKLGYLVISGCYSQAGIDKLQGKVASAVLCDVTKEAQVTDLVKATEKLVESKGAKLWAILNNAGIAPIGLTRGSRVLNLCSMAGVSGLQMFAAYSGSKHAVEGYAKCLRLELHPWGIHVCNINPTFMRTPIINTSQSAAEQELSRAPPEITSQYDLQMCLDQQLVIHRLLEDPVIVVREICEVVSDKVPPFHSYVGWSTGLIRLGLSLPDCIQNWAQNLTSSRFSPKAEAIKKYQG